MAIFNCYVSSPEGTCTDCEHVGRFNWMNENNHLDITTSMELMNCIRVFPFSNYRLYHIISHFSSHISSHFLVLYSTSSRLVACTSHHPQGTKTTDLGNFFWGIMPSLFRNGWIFTEIKTLDVSGVCVYGVYHIDTDIHQIITVMAIY